MMANEKLYWARYIAASGRLELYSVGLDGGNAGKIGEIANAGADLVKMEYFTYRVTFGEFSFEQPALVILLGNGRLLQFTFASGSVVEYAAGITDFAMHRSNPFLGSPRHYIYAAESDATTNPSRNVEPGKLWRINSAVPSERILVYQADSIPRSQILSVTVDPGPSGTFGPPKNIYIADAPVDCSGLFCVLGNISIRRARLPAPDPNPAEWDTIVNDAGGGNLRSDGDWLYFVLRKKIFRVKTDAPAIEFDLRALGIEVTQAIQDLAQSVPLIAGKEGTVVRGYAHVTTSNTDDEAYFPDAMLSVTRNETGEHVAGSPFYSVNNAMINGSDVLGALRSDGTRSFRFELGKLPLGLLRFEMTVNPNANPSETGNEPYANNSAARVLETRASLAPCLVMIPMPTPSGSFPIYDDDLPDIIRRAESMLPVTHFNLHCWLDLAEGHVGDIAEEVFFQEPFSDPDEDDQDNEALDAVECMRQNSAYPGGCKIAHWIGMVHPGAYGSWGLGKRPGSSLIAGMSDGGGKWNSSAGGVTLAHELGHNYGRRHVACGGPDNPDLAYPYNPCWISPGDTASTYYGFDPISLNVITPFDAADTMSYRDSLWPSDYTWGHIWGVFYIFGPLAVEPSGNLPDTVLFVNGTVYPEREAAMFSTFFELPTDAFDQTRVMDSLDASLLEAGVEGHLALRLLDLAGNELSRTALPLVDVHDSRNRLGFSHYIPSHPAMRRIQLVRGETVWAERVVSPNAPVIDLAPPVLDPATETVHLSWTAHDPDGEPLYFLVHYSPDNGENWFAYRINYRARELTLSTRHWHGGSQARVRVIAGDGVRSAQAVSDPFELPAHAPQAMIGGVQPGQRIPFGTPLKLYGLGMDAEDGRNGVRLNWTLSGPTPFEGTDTLVALNHPAPGTYTAELTATDPDNQSSTTTKNFEILPLVIPDGQAPLMDGLCNDAGYTDAAFLRFPVSDRHSVPVRLVHADGFLYVSFTELEFSLNRSGNPQTIGIRFDIDGDGSLSATEQDIGFFVDQNGIPFQEEGGRQGMSITVSPKQGFVARVRPGEQGWCAEFQIDETLLGGWGHGVRLMLAQDDAAWPPAANQDQPQSWAPAWLGTALPEAENRAPVADAGQPRKTDVSSPRVVLLNGNNSYDPDGDPINYLWTQLEGPEVALNDPNTESPHFRIETLSEPTDFRFQLMVNDGQSDSAPAETTVTLVPAQRMPVPSNLFTHFTDDGFYGRFSGEPGRRYEIEASRDLEQWDVIAENIADFQGFIDFVDAQMNQFNYRFYRTVGQ